MYENNGELSGIRDSPKFKDLSSQILDSNGKNSVFPFSIKNLISVEIQK